MQKINIHFRKSIEIKNLEHKIKELISKAEGKDTDIFILENSEGVSCFDNPQIRICCEMFAYETPDISPKESILKEIFDLLEKEIKIQPINLSGIIHQLNKDHYITNSKKVTIEKFIREDSFKTLGL